MSPVQIEKKYNDQVNSQKILYGKILVWKEQTSCETVL